MTPPCYTTSASLLQNQLPGGNGRNHAYVRTRLAELRLKLEKHAIEAQEILGRNIPSAATMHDRRATVPALVVSPKSEWGVAKALKLIKEWNLYDQFQVSVKSGGHGYFNGASCSGIMIDLATMNQRSVVGDTLFLQPGCVLAQITDILATNGKAVPHGDCFGVGAGGHFLTAGWDPVLSRRYGLGCQSVIGGRVVLWDGEVVDVDEETHPQLLYAMRGGAVAEVGVVTEIRLRLFDQPALVAWRCKPMTWEQVHLCTTEQAFQRAATLPETFRYHSSSTLNQPKRNRCVPSTSSAFGPCATLSMSSSLTWKTTPLLDVRLLSASRCLSENPGMLAEASARGLYETPELFWNDQACRREMASSYVHAVSYWVKLDCDKMLLALWDQFSSAKEPELRSRMYALVILGGGAITERQEMCSMPLGQALARFNLQRDGKRDQKLCEDFTSKISRILESHEDKNPGRPYRGDIWRADQAYNENDPLKEIHWAYNRRSWAHPKSRI